MKTNELEIGWFKCKKTGKWCNFFYTKSDAGCKSCLKEIEYEQKNKTKHNNR